MQTEERTAKPSLLKRALRVVRGGGTAQLVERFTQEMTLVAEGLCEDQARLRKAVDGLDQREQSAQERSVQQMDALDAHIRQQERELSDLMRRVTLLEQQMARRSGGMWQRLRGRRVPWKALLLGLLVALVLLKLLT